MEDDDQTPTIEVERERDDERLEPGTRIGPYVILAQIGRGGMGQVFLGSDPRLQRKVALKCVIRSLSGANERRLRILQEARAQYDLVVIDCAPVMLFADALLIGPKTDGLILVYKSGRTARGALKRAKDQLINVKSRVLGVVLNDLHAAEMEPHYGYYYYSYKYESQESPVPPKR